MNTRDETLNKVLAGWDWRMSDPNVWFKQLPGQPSRGYLWLMRWGSRWSVSVTTLTHTWKSAESTNLVTKGTLRQCLDKAVSGVVELKLRGEM
jgi:hypothetical protein